MAFMARCKPNTRTFKHYKNNIVYPMIRRKTSLHNEKKKIENALQIVRIKTEKKGKTEAIRRPHFPHFKLE